MRGELFTDGGPKRFMRAKQTGIDVAVFIISVFLAFIIRFEGLPDPLHLKQLSIFFPFLVLARILCFRLFSIYAIAWRYISIRDALSVVEACLPVTAVLFAGRLFLPHQLDLFRFPYSVIALEFSFVLLGTMSARMVRRLIHERSERVRFEGKVGPRRHKRVLLIGAGDAGNMAVKELLQRADLGLDPAGFIDDDPAKRRSVIQGVRILGGTSQLPAIARKLGVEEAIITIANASSKDIRRIVEICKGVPLDVKIIPGLFEMLGGGAKVSKIREINIEDLLGRSVVHLENDTPAIVSQYRKKKILVTGAGGSIGSELCRQLATYRPQEILLLDKDENSIYEIDQELRRGSGIPAIPLIADVRNEARLRWIFEKYRPDIVFHAAAHKHVPLMESNSAEAVLNNVGGTLAVSTQADRSGVERFIFISTDKAVHPASVMGATKKIGEILIQRIAARSRTSFSCVRFGNVLGSRGSVVPLFQRQIVQGGPITITHPEITRYFMSISEAVQLIIQAGTIGDKGEIFVLDMGDPIRIVDLARDLIKLSGFSEGEFEFRFTGLRPGEKLHEEILVDEEKDQMTRFKKIFVAPPVEIDYGKFAAGLESLLRQAEAGDEDGILQGLKAIEIGFTLGAFSSPSASSLVH